MKISIYIHSVNVLMKLFPAFQLLGILSIMLEEKLEELKTYTQEMERDKSKFDPDVLTNISNRLVSAAYELSQSYENYKSARPTH